MKITVLILSVLMSLCFMLTGCGGGSQAVNAPDENAFANIVDDYSCLFNFTKHV